jgi:hypothetical protein
MSFLKASGRGKSGEEKAFAAPHPERKGGSWRSMGVGHGETTEQRIESAMRVLFDLDGSRDASWPAARLLRMARNGQDRAALYAELRKIQFKLSRRSDEGSCRRLADIVFEAAAAH